MVGLGTGAPIVQVYHEKSFVLPDVSRVLACLYEKDVKFETHTASYRSLLRLQASSHAPVPFYDGPIFLEESREICRYIAEKYEHQGYPFLLGKDALERASVEQWLHNEEHAFNPPSRALFCHLAFPLGEEDDIDIHTRKLEEVLEVYEQRLSDSEFLVGNKFTLADLVHLPNSHYIKASNKFLYLYDSRKNVRRWWDAISDRDSWKKVLRYMKSVEEKNIQELKQQQQQQEEDPRTSANPFRVDSRKHIRTEPQTILVPPADNVPSASIVPQTKKPLPDDHLVSTQQGKSRKDVQQYPSQDSERATSHSVPQEPMSMELVQERERTTRRPYTDQSRDVLSQLDFASSDQRGALLPPSQEHGVTPSRQAAAKDARSRVSSQAAYPGGQDTSKQPRDHGSVPRQGEPQDARDIFDESQAADSTISSEGFSYTPQSSLPRQDLYGAHHATAPFETRYPGGEATSKQAKDKISTPVQMTDYDAGDSKEETKVSESSSFQVQPSYFARADAPSQKQETIDDTFKETEYGDPSFHWDKKSGTWQTASSSEDQEVNQGGHSMAPPSETRYQSSTPPYKRRYPITEDASKQPRGTAPTPKKKGAQDDDTSEESKTADEVASTQQPLDAWRPSVSPRRQKVEDSSRADTSFQKRHPYDEEDIQAANTASVSRETAPDGDKNIFEETKLPDSTPTSAKPMYTQQAPFPPRQAEVKDAKDKGRQSTESQKMVSRDAQTTQGERRAGTLGEQSSDRLQAIPQSSPVAAKGLSTKKDITNEHTVVPPLLSNDPTSQAQPASESLASRGGLSTKPSTIEQWQRASVPLNDPGDGEIGMASIDQKLAPMSQQATPSSEDINQMAKESGEQRVESPVQLEAETPGVQSASPSFPGASTAHHATSADKFTRQSVIDERVGEPAKMPPTPYSAPAHTRETSDGSEITDSKLVSTPDGHISEPAKIRQDQAKVHEDVHDVNLSAHDVAKDTFKEAKVAESTPSSAKPVYPQQPAPTSRHAEVEDTWDKGVKGRETVPDRQQMLQKWAGTVGEQVSDHWKASPPSRQAAAEDVRGTTGETIESPDVLDTSKESRGAYEEAKGPGSVKEKTSSIYQKPLVAQASQEQAQTIPAGEKVDGSVRKHQRASDAPNSFVEKLNASEPARVKTHGDFSDEQPYRKDTSEDQKVAPTLSTRELASQFQPPSEPSYDAALQRDLSSKPSTINQWQRSSAPLQAKKSRDDPARVHEDVYDVDLSTQDVGKDAFKETKVADSIPSSAQPIKKPALTPSRQTQVEEARDKSMQSRETIPEQQKMVERKTGISGEQLSERQKEIRPSRQPAAEDAPISEAPHDSDSFQYVHTGDMGITELAKPTVTDEEATVPAAGPTSVVPEGADIVTAGVAYSEQKSTPPDKGSARSAQPPSTVEPIKADSNVSAANYTKEPQMIFQQQARSSAPSTIGIPASDTQGVIGKTQEVTPNKRGTDDSGKPFDLNQEHVSQASPAIHGQEEMTSPQGSRVFPTSDTQLASAEVHEVTPQGARVFPDARDITPSSAPGEAALAEQKSASSGQGSADPAQPAFSHGPRSEEIRDSPPSAILIPSTDPSKGDPAVAERDQLKDSHTASGQQDILSAENPSGKIQENIPGDDLGKAKPSRPSSAVQEGKPSKASVSGIQLGSVPNEISVDEQKFAPPGQDSAYLARPSSSAEPRSKEIGDLAPSTQLNSTIDARNKDAIVAAPDQATDSQTTGGQVKLSAPSSQGPLGKLQEDEPADDSGETKSAKPRSVVREGKPAASVPISAPDTQHGAAPDQVAVEQKFAPSGQGSVHSVQTPFSTESTKEDTIVAATDQTSRLERTVDQNYMTPAAEKAKTPFSGTPDASRKTHKSIEDDHIDEKPPSQGQVSPDRHVSESPQGHRPEAHSDVVDKETTPGSSQAEPSKTEPGSTSISADARLSSSDMPAASSLPETQDLQDSASAQNVFADSFRKIKPPGDLSTDQSMAPIMSPSVPSVAPLGTVPGTNSVQLPQQVNEPNSTLTHGDVLPTRSVQNQEAQPPPATQAPTSQELQDSTFSQNDSSGNFDPLRQASTDQIVAPVINSAAPTGAPQGTEPGLNSSQYVQSPFSTEPTKEDTVVTAADQAKDMQTITHQQAVTPVPDTAKPPFPRAQDASRQESTPDDGPVENYSPKPEAQTQPPAATLYASTKAESTEQGAKPPTGYQASSPETQLGSSQTQGEAAPTEQKIVVSDKNSADASKSFASAEPRKEDTDAATADQMSVPLRNVTRQVTSSTPDASDALSRDQESSPDDGQIRNSGSPLIASQEATSRVGRTSEGSTPKVHSSIVDEKRTLPSSQAQTSSTGPDSTQIVGDARLTGVGMPATRSMEKQEAEPPAPTEAPTSKGLQDSRKFDPPRQASTDQIVEPAINSAAPTGVPQGTEPGPNSSRSVQTSLSTEPTEGDTGVPAADQAKDMQTITHQQAITPVPGTAKPPFPGAQDASRQESIPDDGPDENYSPKPGAQTQPPAATLDVSPYALSKANSTGQGAKPPTGHEASSLETQLGSSQTQGEAAPAEQKFATSDEKSAKASKSFDSAEPREEDKDAAAADQTTVAPTNVTRQVTSSTPGASDALSRGQESSPDDGQIRNLRSPLIASQEEASHAGREGSTPKVHSAIVDEKRTLPSSQAQTSSTGPDSTQIGGDARITGAGMPATSSMGKQEEEPPAATQAPTSKALQDTGNIESPRQAPTDQTVTPESPRQASTDQTVTPAMNSAAPSDAPEGSEPGPNSSRSEQTTLSTEPTKEENVVTAADQAEDMQTITHQQAITPAPATGKPSFTGAEVAPRKFQEGTQAKASNKSVEQSSPGIGKENDSSRLDDSTNPTKPES